MFSAVICTDPTVSFCYNAAMLTEAIKTLEGLPIGQTFLLDLSGSSNVKAAHQAMLAAGKITNTRIHALKGQNHLVKVTRITAEEYAAYIKNCTRRGRKPKLAVVTSEQVQ